MPEPVSAKAISTLSLVWWLLISSTPFIRHSCIAFNFRKLSILSEFTQIQVSLNMILDLYSIWNFDRSYGFIQNRDLASYFMSSNQCLSSNPEGR